MNRQFCPPAPTSLITNLRSEHKFLSIEIYNWPVPNKTHIIIGMTVSSPCLGTICVSIYLDVIRQCKDSGLIIVSCWTYHINPIVFGAFNVVWMFVRISKDESLHVLDLDLILKGDVLGTERWCHQVNNLGTYLYGLSHTQVDLDQYSEVCNSLVGSGESASLPTICITYEHQFNQHVCH